MTRAVDICSLDYLVGTIATAYKGVISSLVAKDFCITESDGTVTLKGTVLSMPAGSYQARLIHEGLDISRTEMREGFFELTVDSGIIRKTRNLQIDIIQKGRHIGTFLLKREKADAFFITALELSEELKGTNFRLLTSCLRGKPGLLRRAEDIISQILSTKKDWKKFSEELHSFSKDLFWFDGDAFFAWYAVLVKHSLAACEKLVASGSGKPVSNLLSLMELPLENETDGKKVGLLADVWLRETAASRVNLSYRFSQARRVIAGIHEKVPSSDMRGPVKSLLSSLKERVEKSPVIRDSLLDTIKDVISPADLAVLDRYSEKTRGQLLLNINTAETLLEEKSYGEAFEKLADMESALTDDTEMVNDLFGVVEKSLNEDSAKVLIKGLYETFPVLDTLSSGAYQRAVLNTAAILERLVTLRMRDACKSIFLHIEKGPVQAKDEIVLNPEVARSILSAEDPELLNKYKDIMKQIIIPAPGVEGFSGETWAEVVNPRHLERLSKFLSIIRIDSVSFRDILIHVICNTYLSGVLIPDEKLFQREVSSFIASDAVRSNFLLSYMLLKKLPVYYHEVGATGRLRDDTTEIDSWGDDPVLYFLRKQVHVNASNYNVLLLETILRSWVCNDPGLLKGAVPEEVLSKLDNALLAEYSSVIRRVFKSLSILEGEVLHIERIPGLPESALRERLKDMGVSAEISAKIRLICMIYQGIAKKYSPGVGLSANDSADVPTGLSEHLKKIRGLKEIIVSPEKTRADEALYFKRHIAFGIPSVMGSYHEPKFDAFGEVLRNGERMRVMVEDAINDIEGKEGSFSAEEVRRWIECLDSLNGQFILHDLGNFQVAELLTILRTNTLHLSQIIDLLRIWQRELTCTVDFFYSMFHGPLTEILNIFPSSDLPERLKGPGFEGGDFVNKATDVILRDMVDSVPGFTELDRFIGGLLSAFALRISSGRDEKIALSGIPEPSEEYFVIHELSEPDAMRLAPALGGKAKNLAYLTHDGLNVPSGVVFSSGLTKNYLGYLSDDRFDATLRSAVRTIEARTGKVLGGRRRPLFLSVRSGSYISMPGILSSILYCGMNTATLGALIDETGNPWLGWDSYRRFIEDYACVVYGLAPKVFEDISRRVMEHHKTVRREDLGAEQLEEISGLYLTELRKRELVIPEDVYAQLKAAIRAVYRSWYDEKAMQFRKAMNVSDHWGTAVTLMQMISGNESGAGASVFFTRMPFSLEKGIYGDTRERATGADIVSGRLVNLPLSRKQATDGRKSLEETDPKLFRMHEELAERIEEKMGGLPQEVEVTYVRGPDGERVIYVLQTKRMEFHRGFTKRFDDICRMESNIIGRGTGVHGGALSGVATFSSSPEQVRRLKNEAGLPVILLRSMASTDDVSLMPEIDGIITAGGGVASHASVLAQKFDLTAVIGCSGMEIKADEKGQHFAKIGTDAVREGTLISIDGSTGLVYSGLCLLTTEVHG